MESNWIETSFDLTISISLNGSKVACRVIEDHVWSFLQNCFARQLHMKVKFAGSRIYFSPSSLNPLWYMVFVLTYNHYFYPHIINIFLLLLLSYTLKAKRMEEPDICLFYFKFKSQLRYDWTLHGLNAHRQELLVFKGVKLRSDCSIWSLDEFLEFKEKIEKR